MNTIHMSHIARLKWRHWLLITLLAIVTVVRSSHSLGLAYTTKVYPVIGGLLSPLSGSVPFALGDIFIASVASWKSNGFNADMIDHLLFTASRNVLINMRKESSTNSGDTRSMIFSTSSSRFG